MTLLERYKNNVGYASRAFGKLSSSKQACLAQSLYNTEKVIKEAYEAGSATQVSNIGTFKKFVMSVVTYSMPNLIAYDLVITKPMQSITGYITYLKYNYGQTKGAALAGQTIQTPFSIQGTDPNYTSAATVNETVLSGTASTPTASVTLQWTPIIPGTVSLKIGTGLTATIITDDGAGNIGTGNTIDYVSGVITFGTAIAASTRVLAIYKYDNLQIPAAKLPTITAEQAGIALKAEPRRIAIRYSTISALIAKTDYDIDLSAELVRKATSQLAFEIDTEIVTKLVAAAATEATLNWSKILPTGVSKRDHYQGFMEVVETASAMIFERTGKYAATYMICGTRVKPILTFIEGWAPAAQGGKVGPYMAGTLDGIKVFLDPRMPSDTFVFGVKGDDLETAAAVYAPYIPVIPTQLLETPDHGAMQGWASLYDFKILNSNLLVKGTVVEAPDSTPLFTVQPDANSSATAGFKQGSDMSDFEFID